MPSIVMSDSAKYYCFGHTITSLHVRHIIYIFINLSPVCVWFFWRLYKFRCLRHART